MRDSNVIKTEGMGCGGRNDGKEEKEVGKQECGQTGQKVKDEIGENTDFHPGRHVKNLDCCRKECTELSVGDIIDTIFSFLWHFSSSSHFLRGDIIFRVTKNNLLKIKETSA